jgi:hypothetical protein
MWTPESGTPAESIQFAVTFTTILVFFIIVQGMKKISENAASLAASIFGGTPSGALTGAELGLRGPKRDSNPIFSAASKAPGKILRGTGSLAAKTATSMITTPAEMLYHLGNAGRKGLTGNFSGAGDSLKSMAYASVRDPVSFANRKLDETKSAFGKKGSIGKTLSDTQDAVGGAANSAADAAKLAGKPLSRGAQAANKTYNYLKDSNKAVAIVAGVVAAPFGAAYGAAEATGKVTSKIFRSFLGK